jgi:hypothetical protein
VGRDPVRARLLKRGAAVRSSLLVGRAAFGARLLARGAALGGADVTFALGVSVALAGGRRSGGGAEGEEECREGR